MLIGFLTSLGLLAVFVLHNLKRSRLTEVKELKPNCLLTSSPVVFISGKRSLFYFMAYWNEIPHWLASHGYDVFSFSLPWLDTQKRISSLRDFLTEKSKFQNQIHLFFDESSEFEVSSLLSQEDFSCLASATLIGKETAKSAGSLHQLRPLKSVPIELLELPIPNQKRPLFWILHLLWTQQNVSISQLGWKMEAPQADILLDRMQFLAERDLLRNQSSPTL